MAHLAAGPRGCPACTQQSTAMVGRGVGVRPSAAPALCLQGAAGSIAVFTNIKLLIDRRQGLGRCDVMLSRVGGSTGRPHCSRRAFFIHAMNITVLIIGKRKKKKKAPFWLSQQEVFWLAFLNSLEAAEHSLFCEKGKKGSCYS